MCTGKIVKNIIGKDVGKDRNKDLVYDKVEWKYTDEGKSYLHGRKSKKTPKYVVDDINKKFKTK